MYIWLSIVLATLAIQIPNMWAIKSFAANPTWHQAAYVSFICLPSTFISTACYAYFYGMAYKQFSYPTLAIAAYGVSLSMAFILQYVLLKSKTITWVDLSAMTFVLLGLSLMIGKEKLLKM